MNQAGAKDLVRGFFSASGRGDIEAALGLLADDVTWTVSGTTSFSGQYVGKKVLVEKLVGPLFGRLKAGIVMTIHNLVAEGDCVVAEATGEAETREGRPYRNTYCFVFRIRDGKIAGVTEYMDTALVTAVFGG
ncbi:MAG TPA: nuclear transport factor 2 family protein [Candidatus Xenobia bacterium]|nr:nuclear transport factor 2 family protein [Candidatus Xenobia bacterium]